MDVTLHVTLEGRYNGQAVTPLLSVHSVTLWTPLVAILYMLCLISKSCPKLIISNYCMACYNKAVTILSY